MNHDPSAVLTNTVARLSTSDTIEAITHVVTEAARQLVGADGTTFVLRDEGRCFYADENAISPLWKGKKFPMESCISGWAMIHRRHVVIRDIYQDARIPHDAYRPTFVKSLCMVPIRDTDPIGAIGTYWSQEHAPSDDEIKLLQVLANNSAVSLENLELKRSIKNESARNSGLAERQRELEMALHSLAHDLRSPVATIIGFADLLAEAPELRESAKLSRFVDAIQRTGETALSQIQRMLELYLSSHRAIEKKHVDLTAVATELSTELRTRNASREIRFDIQPELAASADPVLSRLVIDNLFSNAVKYTRGRSPAIIRFGKSPSAPGMGTFYVSDNGAGFDPSEARKLFRPLVRLHDQAEFEGTGLGLAAVARIIERHGGSVRAEGTKNVGATIFFDLPAS